MPGFPEDLPIHVLDLPDAAAFLARGGIVIYPTETYYAIGCRADNSKGATLIHRLKKRPSGKPLPLLAADMAQIAAASAIPPAAGRLFELFWPGPLTVLLPAASWLAPQFRDERGLCAIRMSAGATAAALATLAGRALAATSANFSGEPPAAHAASLSGAFLAAAGEAGACLLASGEASRWSLPSTIVEPVQNESGQMLLRVLRVGAVDKKTLRKENFLLAP